MEIENYKDVFIEETKDNIGGMNRALLDFEKNPADLTPINELFRYSHSLKGMSATMGYDSLAGFTHMLEEALELIRAGKALISVDIINALFKSVDVISEYLESITDTGKDTSAAAARVSAEIKRHVSGGASAEFKPPAMPFAKAVAVEDMTMAGIPLEVEPTILAAAQAQGLKVFKLAIKLEKNCAFKSVRAFMATRNLSENGEIIKSNPPSKDIEDGNFGDEFYMLYITKQNKEAVQSILMKISEVEAVRVMEVAVTSAAGSTANPVAPEVNTANEGAEIETGFRIKKEAATQSVRVNIQKLDTMMNLVGELVIAKIRLDQIYKEKKYNTLQETITELDRIIDSLQLEVTEVRMLPVSHIFDRYPRMARDLASASGKEVEVELTGGDIEIDRTVLEEINEPILHLIRNSVAHGIEIPEDRARRGKPKKGVIRLMARREKNSVVIEVSDDGNGIDVERVKQKAIDKGIVAEDRVTALSDEEIVNLISLPGFSTVEAVNSVSGRGVGVDVVKTKVEAVGGLFKIENYPGEGSKFILKLPLTLAIIQALLVKNFGNVYALPVIHTVETLELPGAEIRSIQEKRVIVLRGEVIPVVSLDEALGKPRRRKEIVNLVIVEIREKKIAVEVDEVMGQQEVAIKSLGDFLKYAKGFSGVTILGDGRISLIIDLPSLI